MLTDQYLTHKIIKSRVRAEFLIAELSHIFRGVLLCQRGPVSAWCYVIVALCRHGAVSTWHCVGIAVSSGPMSAGAVSSWHFVGLVLCHHGPVSAGAVSTWQCVGILLCCHGPVSAWCCFNMALCRHSAVIMALCRLVLCQHDSVLA